MNQSTKTRFGLLLGMFLLVYREYLESTYVFLLPDNILQASITTTINVVVVFCFQRICLHWIHWITIQFPLQCSSRILRSVCSRFKGLIED